MIGKVGPKSPWSGSEDHLGAGQGAQANPVDTGNQSILQTVRYSERSSASLLDRAGSGAHSCLSVDLSVSVAKQIGLVYWGRATVVVTRLGARLGWRQLRWCDTRLSSRPHLSEEDLGRRRAVGNPERCLNRGMGLREGGRHIPSKHVHGSGQDRTGVSRILFTLRGDLVSQVYWLLVGFFFPISRN